MPNTCSGTPIWVIFCVSHGVILHEITVHFIFFLFHEEWCRHKSNRMIIVHCFFKRHRPCDFMCTYCMSDCDLKSFKWTSWTKWEFSELQYLLFLFCTSLHNVNHALSGHTHTHVLDQEVHWLLVLKTTCSTSFLCLCGCNSVLL